MECEVCGGRISGKPHLVMIEGGKVRTCSRCARFGSEVREPKQVHHRRSKRVPRQEPELEPVDDYSERIRRAREARGLSQEELARMVQEKESVIARLEAGRMKPDLETARKLERVLEIELMVEAEGEEWSAQGGGTGGELTIGDIIKIKKRG
ncbi:MAG: TIGR00270 family protein [Euryarchaeota archaeon]|nr:TIGR00270 family protein [Euryarchaeota archaeon]